MAGLSDDDRAELHVTVARLQRAMEDVQCLYHLQKINDTELHNLRNKTKSLYEATRRNEAVLKELMDDKKSLFRGALALIALFIITASYAALSIKVVG